jgi:very-short-patch-repair endonuclease
MRKVVTCGWCNTNFEAYVSQNRKFCTHACSINYTKNHGQLKTGSLINCDTCNINFYKAPYAMSKNNYCSIKCKNNGAIVPRIKLICSLNSCNNIFYRTKKNIENSKFKKLFCSTHCGSKNALRVIQSSKHKIKGTKPELEFKLLLENNKINYIFQYAVQWKNGWKKWYDFYIPAINTLIEIDGTYWHGKNLLDEQLNNQQHQTRLNDNVKDELAKTNNYSLIRIWSDEITNFKFNKLKI